MLPHGQPCVHRVLVNEQHRIGPFKKMNLIAHIYSRIRVILPLGIYYWVTSLQRCESLDNKLKLKVEIYNGQIISNLYKFNLIIFDIFYFYNYIFLSFMIFLLLKFLY